MTIYYTESGEIIKDGKRLLPCEVAAELMRLEKYDNIMSGLQGCSDHGCMVNPPKGMGTNGGCRCSTIRYVSNIIFSRLSAIRRYHATSIQADENQTPNSSGEE